MYKNIQHINVSDMNFLTLPNIFMGLYLLFIICIREKVIIHLSGIVPHIFSQGV